MAFSKQQVNVLTSKSSLLDLFYEASYSLRRYTWDVPWDSGPTLGARKEAPLCRWRCLLVSPLNTCARSANHSPWAKSSPLPVYNPTAKDGWKKNQRKNFCNVKIIQNSNFSVYKYSFLKKEPYPFVYILSVITFAS